MCGTVGHGELKTLVIAQLFLVLVSLFTTHSALNLKCPHGGDQRSQQRVKPYQASMTEWQDLSIASSIYCWPSWSAYYCYKGDC